MKFKSFCELFQDIAKDPSKMQTDLTVLDFLKARQHILTCQECSDIVDRVCDQDPSNGSNSGVPMGLN